MFKITWVDGRNINKLLDILFSMNIFFLDIDNFLKSKVDQKLKYNKDKSYW